MSATQGPDSSNRSAASFLNSSFQSISSKAKNLFKGKSLKASNEANVAKGTETADISKKALDTDVASRKKENFPTFKGALERASAGAKSLTTSLGKLTINANLNPEKALGKYETALKDADGATKGLKFVNLGSYVKDQDLKEAIENGEAKLSKLETALTNLKKSSSSSPEAEAALKNHVNDPKGAESKNALQNEVNIAKAKLAQNKYEDLQRAFTAKHGKETPAHTTPEGRQLGDALHELNTALSKFPDGKIPAPQYKKLSDKEQAMFDKTSALMPGNVKVTPENSKVLQKPTLPVSDEITPPKPKLERGPIGGHRAPPKTDEKA